MLIVSIMIDLFHFFIPWLIFLISQFHFISLKTFEYAIWEIFILINDVENEGLNNYLVLRVNYLSLPKKLELMIVLLEF